MSTHAFEEVTIVMNLGGIACVVEGIEVMGGRKWHTIRSLRTGMALSPQAVGLTGPVELQLRAEAECGRAPSLMV